jgi:hypothetical protein
MFTRTAILAGFAAVALAGSASANCIDFKCPPPKCVGVKCYVVSPLPTVKKDYSATPSVPIPPPVRLPPPVTSQ